MQESFPRRYGDSGEGTRGPRDPVHSLCMDSKRQSRPDPRTEPTNGRSRKGRSPTSLYHILPTNRVLFPVFSIKTTTTSFEGVDDGGATDFLNLENSLSSVEVERWSGPRSQTLPKRSGHPVPSVSSVTIPLPTISSDKQSPVRPSR